jgi:hypothetical protein
MVNRRSYLRAMAGALMSVPFCRREGARGKPAQRRFSLLFNSPRSEPIDPCFKAWKPWAMSDGKTISIEYRFAEGKSRAPSRFGCTAGATQAHVIFAFGGDVVPFARRQPHRFRSLPG